jgi:O-antigen/teichoic acid export membrane protein
MVLKLFIHLEQIRTAFSIFTIILPGLLFFSAVIVHDGIYEAAGRVDMLKNKIFIVTILNIGLAVLLAPYARFNGAAAAAAISMFVYFALFGRNLGGIFQIAKFQYVVAGAGIYVIFYLFRYMDFTFKTGLFLIPFIVFLLFFFTGFFDIQERTLYRTAKTRQ